MQGSEKKQFGERYEGEGTCAASPFERAGRLSIKNFWSEHGVLVERGVSSFLRADLWLR